MLRSPDSVVKTARGEEARGALAGLADGILEGPGPAGRFPRRSLLLTRVEAGAISACMLVFAADSALGQERYPSRVIRIVTATPGSNHDWGARLVAQELTPRLGQRVIVENRGSIAVEHVAKEAAPDGYSLLFY